MRSRTIKNSGAQSARARGILAEAVRHGAGRKYDSRKIKENEATEAEDAGVNVYSSFAVVIRSAATKANWVGRSGTYGSIHLCGKARAGMRGQQSPTKRSLREFEERSSQHSGR